MGGGYDVPDVRKLVMRVFLSLLSSYWVRLFVKVYVCVSVCALACAFWGQGSLCWVTFALLLLPLLLSIFVADEETKSRPFLYLFVYLLCSLRRLRAGGCWLPVWCLPCQCVIRIIANIPLLCRLNMIPKVQRKGRARPR